MTENTSIGPKSNRAKYGVRFLLLIAAAIEVYFLLYDFPFFKPFLQGKNHSTQDNPPIARLVQKQNTVRTQFPNELVWEDAVSQQDLYKRETLFTSDRSQAEVAFLDGTQLTIEENSLIQIEQNQSPTSEGRIMIKLLRGGIRKSKGQKQPSQLRSPEVAISLGGTLLEFGFDSEFKVHDQSESPGEKGQFSVSVAQGTVALKSPSNNPQVLKKDEEGSVNSQDPHSIVKVRRPQWIPRSPLSGQIIEAVENTEVTFQWETQGTTESNLPTELEVSSDPQFKSNLHHLTIARSNPPLKHIEAKVVLPVSHSPVLWHWRLRATHGNGLFSSVNRFWIQQKERPELQFPPHQTHFSLGKSVELIWSPVPQAMHYEVQFDQQSPKVTASTTFRLENLPEGSVRWKVRARYPNDTFSAWSEPRTIIVDPRLPPPPAQIFAPEIEPVRSHPKPGHRKQPDAKRSKK
jgi:hypothetical protein